tara:strand:- start:1058 stop:3517 length:2460 start_codon:yes stop_codon:yes gene_type:complete
MTYIKNNLLFLVFLTFLYSYQNANHWNSLTSALNSYSIIEDSNGHIIGATSGGLLKLSDSIEILKDNLIDINTNVIGIDLKNNIWIGNNSPNSTIQVLDKNYNLIYSSIYSLQNLENILDFAFDSDKVFCIYKDLDGYGILEFNYEDQTPFYLDYYNASDFPQDYNQITDIDIYQEYLYVTTDSGVFVANFMQDNLNFGSSWTKIPFDVFIGDQVIKYLHRVENGFYILTVNELFFCSLDFITESLIVFDSEPSDIKPNDFELFLCSQYDCYKLLNSNIENIYSNDRLFLINDFQINQNMLSIAIKNGGISKINLNDRTTDFYIPNTLLENSYEAITLLDDGSLAGVNKKHLFIMKNDTFYFYINEANIDNYPLSVLSNNEYFNFTILDYKVSDKMIWSLVQNSIGNLMFNNSGIKPNLLNKMASVIEVDITNNEYFLYDTSKTEFMKNTNYPYGTFDGLYGVSNEDVLDSYMVTHQIKKDNLGNVWVVNPYSEKFNHPLSVQIGNNNQHWMHIFSENEFSYIPTEIAFDKYNRVWLGYINEDTNNNCCIDEFSKGGLQAFQFDVSYINGTDFSDYENSVFWLNPTNLGNLPYGENSTILSLDIGNIDDQEILWVLTPQGAQGYIMNNTQLLEIYPIPFYSNIGFQVGDKIRVDSQNNAWIATRYDGVRVIKNNATLWPDGFGFTKNNSSLLSNIIYDIAFNNEDGLVYFSTDKGISILETPFSSEKLESEKLFITPLPFVIPSNDYMQIKNIITGSDVKVLTVNGSVVKHFDDLEFNQNMIYWDGKSDNGNYLSSGIYYVLSYKDGNSLSKKIAIIRK